MSLWGSHVCGCIIIVVVIVVVVVSGEIWVIRAPLLKKEELLVPVRLEENYDTVVVLLLFLRKSIEQCMLSRVFFL